MNIAELLLGWRSLASLSLYRYAIRLGSPRMLSDLGRREKPIQRTHFHLKSYRRTPILCLYPASTPRSSSLTEMPNPLLMVSRVVRLARDRRPSITQVCDKVRGLTAVVDGKRTIPRHA